jgi:hypothetical protein
VTDTAAVNIPDEGIVAGQASLCAKPIRVPVTRMPHPRRYSFGGRSGWCSRTSSDVIWINALERVPFTLARKCAGTRSRFLCVVAFSAENRSPLFRKML